MFACHAKKTKLFSSGMIVWFLYEYSWSPTRVAVAPPAGEFPAIPFFLYDYFSEIDSFIFV